MTRKKKKEKIPITRPAETPEEQEDLMIALSMKLAEKKLRDGTASSQIITHYLKLASEKRERDLDERIKEKQIEYLDAKTKSIDSDEEIKELYKDAMNDLRIYRGEK